MDPVPSLPGCRPRGGASRGDAHKFSSDRCAPIALAFPNPPPAVEHGIHGVVAVVGKVGVVINGAPNSVRGGIFRSGFLGWAVGVAYARTISLVERDVEPAESELEITDTHTHAHTNTHTMCVADDRTCLCFVSLMFLCVS